MTSLHGTPNEIIFNHMQQPYTLSYPPKPLPPDDSVLGLLLKSKENTIFAQMIYASGFDGLLSNPLANVTLFLPPDKVLLTLQDSLYTTLSLVPLKNFVGYHIVRGALPVQYMMGQRGFVETYYPEENLEIRGFGLSPQIGEVYYSSAMVPSVWKQANVLLSNSDIRVGNSLIHLINQPLTPYIGTESRTRGY
jgi:hypothetical protein